MTAISLVHSAYKVDSVLVRPMFYTRGCMSGCLGECCDEGNFVSDDRIGEILRNEQAVQKRLRPGVSSRWFVTAGGLSLDENLPHRPLSVETAVYPDDNSRTGFSCAFLDGDGECVLHTVGNTKFRDGWKLKPLYCFLWPLTVLSGVVKMVSQEDLTASFKIRGRCLLDSRTATLGTTLFKKELQYLLGQRAYRELLTHVK